MGKAKNWTQEEKDYLAENWGTVSINGLCRHLGRSVNGILCMKNRLGLGAFLDSGDYVTFYQLCRAIGASKGGSYRKISYIENRGFPVREKQVGTTKFRIVYLEDFWEWAEKNQDFLDFAKFEENALGAEPAWAKAKRRNDHKKKQTVVTTPWTPAEDARLQRMYEACTWYLSDAAKKLRRSEGAISRRIHDIGIAGEGKFIKHNNHDEWTPEQIRILSACIREGKRYEDAADLTGKTVKGIRGYVYRTYLTENLDKVRAMMAGGSFGDGKPEKRVRDWNCMTTEERIAVRDALTRLAAILGWRFREEVAMTEFGQFFQREMCQNFCGECLKGEGCDSCENYKKIEPQNCKMCGATFWQKKSDLYCPKCRSMRKKQWLRKRFVLQGR